MAVDPKPVQVLLADDSSVMRRIIRNALDELELCFVEAGDGEAALESFEPGSFLAVILDWHMPLRDGIEVIRSIRETDGNVPIIMITSEPESQKHCALDAGATHFLVKPFDADLLKWKLQLMLSEAATQACS